MKRSNSFEISSRLGERLRGDGQFVETYKLLRVTPTIFDDAVTTVERSDQRLSFTDASTVVLAKHHDVDTVLSFDDDFDGVVDRTDPGLL